MRHLDARTRLLLGARARNGVQIVVSNEHDKKVMQQMVQELTLASPHATRIYHDSSLCPFRRHRYVVYSQVVKAAADRVAQICVSASGLCSLRAGTAPRLEEVSCGRMACNQRQGMEDVQRWSHDFDGLVESQRVAELDVVATGGTGCVSEDGHHVRPLDVVQALGAGTIPADRSAARSSASSTGSSLAASSHLEVTSCPAVWRGCTTSSKRRFRMSNRAAT